MYSINSEDYKYKFINWCKNFGVSLNLDNPKTIQDKLDWLNIYDNNNLKCICADKILLHDYCKDILKDDICIPILKIYNSTSEIIWDELPGKFVLKCNHGSEMNIICQNKLTLNKEDAINKLNRWMSIDYGFVGYELHYHDINRKIYVEEYKNDGHKDLIDYKFLCFNGKPLYCQVIGGRHENSKHLNYYDMNFNFVDICRIDFPNNKNIKDEKPNNFDLMKLLAEKLSQPFKFVRVDFYEINNIVYLGELTFTPGCCHFLYKNVQDNIKIGNLLNIKN